VAVSMDIPVSAKPNLAPGVPGKPDAKPFVTRAQVAPA
jgi:hypothetical protein